MSASPTGTAGRGNQPLYGRPAAGLYLISWILGGFGLVGLVVAVQSGPPLRGLLLMGALVLIMAGLSAAAGYQIVSRRSRPPEAFRGPSPLLLFGLQFALVNSLSLVLLALGVPLTESPSGFFIATVVLFGSYVAVVWVFGIRSGAVSWRGLGFPYRASATQLLSDMGFAGGVMLLVVLLAGLGGGLLARLLETSAPQVVPAPGTTLDTLLIALGAGVLLPIGEELFFRGYAMTAWLRDLGPRAALTRSTIFFALVHIATISSETFLEGAKQALLVLAVIGPVGYALGWLFLRRGLIAAMAGHAAYNLFGIVILVLAQNLPPAA